MGVLRSFGYGTETTIENQAETTRVLLVEDPASFRQALAFVLEVEPGFAVTAQAGSLAETLEKSGEEFDVAVVDLTLPDGNGVELIRDLNAKNSDVMVLVLSASLDESQFADAIEAGAAGVLHKSVAIDEIVDTIRRLRAGEALLSPSEVISILHRTSDRRQRDQEAQRAIENLTPREKQVIEALAEGLDSKDIAVRLGISLKTERTHVMNIITKLGVHSRLQTLVFAARHGLVEIR